MEILKEQNNNLTKKNVNMTNEIRTSELALAECLFEKAELKKEVNAKIETVNEIIKQNTLLKEEIKVKDDIIKALSENDIEISENENKGRIMQLILSQQPRIIQKHRNNLNAMTVILQHM